MNKDSKDHKVTARINDAQNGFIEKLIQENKAKTPAGAIQYLINMAMIRGE
ncbi:hypothetical protein [Mangrovibacter sp. MFB070]|uniref:hypothetical protein n=1 Tax=Mangrovibacter sp. MFB070 TaxID=1224318 RepID=UPI00190F7CB8|nr:hypothetical protein [Mangrovibacter sp. MFB070]